MSAPDDRPIYDWREFAGLLYRGPASKADAMREGVYDPDVQAAVLRMLGVRVDLVEGRYHLPRTDENIERLYDLLSWAEGRQHG